MNQEPDHIDQQFHQRLHGAEVQPPAFVWSNIEQALRKRRRRVIFFWLFAIGLSGIATLWGIMAWNNNIRLGISSDRALKTLPAAESNPKEPGSMQQVSETTTGEQTHKASPEINTGAPQAFITTKNDIQPVQQTWSAATGESPARPDDALVLIAMIDNKTGSNTSQNTPREVSLADMAVLENFPAKPLAFKRMNDLPQAKPFIRKNKKKDPHFCYDFSQHPTVWLVDAYVGPTFANKSIESSIPAFDQYRQQRLDTENRDFSFNAGLRGSLLFGQHFLLRTGLHYEQMTEVFEYVDPNYIKYLVEITKTVVDGKPVVIIDTIGVDYGENYTKTFNRYRMLDIPLEGGVELRKGRFGLSLNGGLSFNILFLKRGMILSPIGKPEVFTPGEQGAVDIFRKRTGLSVQGSAQVFFHLKPRLRVFAEPYFRQVLKPVTLENQPVDQRYGIGGIKLGLTTILD